MTKNSKVDRDKCTKISPGFDSKGAQGSWDATGAMAAAPDAEETDGDVL